LPEILCTTIGDDTILTIIDTDENRKRVENKVVDVVKRKEIDMEKEKVILAYSGGLDTSVILLIAVDSIPLLF